MAPGASLPRCGTDRVMQVPRRNRVPGALARPAVSNALGAPCEFGTPRIQGPQGTQRARAPHRDRRGARVQLG
ncbi:protein of unknown function [Blastococcus saxobsidens DD2]|uniref:Uncharacterized protein n=1 Tax=Blastococcus saxobsidens (strain DD2) TaxID=1146883 RepID=H6RT41_BLASD|nr:protein of unknown function [Blastococcus saxobsidens DD2]